MKGRRIVLRAVVLAVCAAPAACASGGSSRTPAGQIDPVTGGPAGGEGMRVGALNARTLGPGECGLFLWSRAGDNPLIFFFNSTSGRAAVNIDDRERNLKRIEVTSSPRGAQLGDQVFATTGGEVTVRVSVHQRQELASGARISRAVVNVADDRGWSAVIGAGGLAACQP